MVVTEDNMTDTARSEVQKKLKESQEELEKLWKQNQCHEEHVKALEAQEQELKGLWKAAQEQSQDFWNQNKQLVHRLQAFEAVENASKTSQQDTDPFKILRTNYIDLHMEKTQLVEKLDKRDSQVKELRKKLVRSGYLEESPGSLPDVRHTQQPLSPGHDSTAEVQQLRQVLQERETKIHNLNVQLNTFQEVASNNAILQQQISRLRAKLKAHEVTIISKSPFNDNIIAYSGEVRKSSGREG